MKNPTILLGSILILLAVCTNETAAEDKADFQPLANGFGFGRHSKVTYPGHRAISADFEYEDSVGKRTIVWPFIDAVSNIQITNNLAILIGQKVDSYADGKYRLTKRIIAFKAPNGPPLDITPQFLQKCSEANGINVTNIIKDGFAWLVKTNDGVQLAFIFAVHGKNGPDSVSVESAQLALSWTNVGDIMNEVEKSGTIHKEKSSGIEYLQKE